MTTVFVSYSWDSERHKKRIKKFVEYLRKNQINVIFDEDMKLGERLQDFMEKGVRDSDYVLMCYTPTYKQRADNRIENDKTTGVAYENTMITGEVYSRNNQCKFIPVLFEGTWKESTPYWATGKLGIDLTGYNIKSEISKLMETLNNNLTAPSNPTPSKRESKKIKKLTITDIPTIAAVATIIGVITAITVAFFGDNLIGRLIIKQGSNEDTQISNDTLNEDYTESITDTSINELLNKLWEDSNYVRVCKKSN